MNTTDTHLIVPIILHIETKQEPVQRRISIPFPPCIRDSWPDNIGRWSKLHDCFTYLLCSDFTFFYASIVSMNDHKGALTIDFSLSSYKDFTKSHFIMMQQAWEECNEMGMYVSAVIENPFTGKSIIVGHYGIDVDVFFKTK